ncbi:MAG: ribonuclease III [Gammaproteobacteria bacterium]|nr:ribonuclease III [Gammaproteobacteria bacterium]
MTRPPIDPLFRHLGHRFQQTELLECALTHRSFRKDNNERLEFLGDAILSFVMAEELYRRFPQAKEGELSRLRASLVKGETLAVLAREFGLGDYLLLGSGELKSGGYRRESILADALEAVIGAIYLDAGMERCRGCVLEWYAERLDALSPQGTLKDPKTRLQEYLQAHRLALPTYLVDSVEGEAHAQVFRVECRIEGLDMTTRGTGSSRRRAEQEAARIALRNITNE